jgi:hypothetical protein
MRRWYRRHFQHKYATDMGCGLGISSDGGKNDNMANRFVWTTGGAYTSNVTLRQVGTILPEMELFTHTKNRGGHVPHFEPHQNMYFRLRKLAHLPDRFYTIICAKHIQQYYLI